MAAGLSRVCELKGVLATYVVRVGLSLKAVQQVRHAAERCLS